MATVRLPVIGTARAWRDAARACLAAGLAPAEVTWRWGEDLAGLFDGGAAPAAAASPMTVPRAFVDLADSVAWHVEPERFARLYALLWRLRSEPRLMADEGDPAVSRLRAMAKAVERDGHKMKAFVRFREIGAADLPRRRFAAWFEPTHHTLEPTAPFFAARFADMDWRILTPALTAIFEDGRLSFAEGAAKPPLPEDATEELWCEYFRSIFNPARLKVRAMQAEMPKKYWANMPEARQIPDLIATADARARAMQAAGPTEPPVRAARLAARATALPAAREAPGTLAALRAEAAGCTRCPLYRQATQVVPGEGPPDAELMFVGEQPGDMEDLAGRPFVGPAGALFDDVCQAAGIDRRKAFVTNAVKHFKHRVRGRRRIHERPGGSEIAACRRWLDAERQLVQPRLIVALGATAAEALTGRGAGILRRRGAVEPGPDGTPVFLTVHPSYLLRLPDPARKAAETERFRRDLEAAADLSRVVC